MTSSGSRSNGSALAAALAVTLLAALFAAWLVRPMVGGAEELPWYVGMAVLAGVGIVGVVVAARTDARGGPLGAMVLLACFGTTVLAVVHWQFIVSGVFSGLTILIVALGALCVALAVRWQRSRSEDEVRG